MIIHAATEASREKVARESVRWAIDGECPGRSLACQPFAQHESDGKPAYGDSKVSFQRGDYTRSRLRQQARRLATVSSQMCAPVVSITGVQGRLKCSRDSVRRDTQSPLWLTPKRVPNCSEAETCYNARCEGTGTLGDLEPQTARARCARQRAARGASGHRSAQRRGLGRACVSPVRGAGASEGRARSIPAPARRWGRDVLSHPLPRATGNGAPRLRPRGPTGDGTDR